MEAINVLTVVWSLEELASRVEQEKLWLSDGSSGEVSSFTEAICGVFDDGGVSRALDSGMLPNDLAAKFTELSNRIDKIPHYAAPQEQIDHPIMKDISQLATELLEMLSKRT
jgi:hypothetical protein